MGDEEIARVRRDRWAATQPAGTAKFDELNEQERARLTDLVRAFREMLDLVRPEGLIMDLFAWALRHASELWKAISASREALAAWQALLADHTAKHAAIDPASPTAADDTATLNKQSVEAAEALLRQYGPERTQGEDDGA